MKVTFGQLVYFKKFGVGSNRPLFRIKTIELDMNSKFDEGFDRRSLYCVVTITAENGTEFITVPDQLVISL